LYEEQVLNAGAGLFPGRFAIGKNGMKAIFLSDAHLKGAADPAHHRLIRFFEGVRGRGAAACPKAVDERLTVDHLVVAGDFFDFWFARGDRVYPGFRPMIERMTALKGEGVLVSLCEGNHDFFLQEYFSGRLGFEVYPEWAEFAVDGLRILVSHGDTVDRGNRKYLALRGFLRSPLTRRLQRFLPLAFLWRVARLSSEMSKEMSEESVDRLVEIMHRFARGKFREGYDAVILGHCHKPILRQEHHDGRQKTFATLGDWVTHSSYLLYDDGRFSLNNLPRER
jgi:UDP-2,3-diacylglucosamine hydrolase